MPQRTHEAQIKQSSRWKKAADWLLQMETLGKWIRSLYPDLCYDDR